MVALNASYRVFSIVLSLLQIYAHFCRYAYVGSKLLRSRFSTYSNRPTAMLNGPLMQCSVLALSRLNPTTHPARRSPRVPTTQRRKSPLNFRGHSGVANGHDGRRSYCCASNVKTWSRISICEKQISIADIYFFNCCASISSVRALYYRLPVATRQQYHVPAHRNLARFRITGRTHICVCV